MLEIKTDNLNAEEIKQMHKLICAFHKIDYSLYIDLKDGYTVATFKEE
jgi:hypothetical protein